MREYHEFLRNGSVAVWVGNCFTTEDEMIEYVDDGPFASDFDFSIRPAAGRELTVEATPVPIEHLAKGFSYWRYFSQEVVGTAQKLDLKIARCMLVVYNVFYAPPETKLISNHKLTFFGNFKYGEL